jgi:GTP-binding protein
MSFLIAIIGRPNVGKSTLFNRLLGKRKALVEDTPGVTRDRNYAFVELEGKSFTLVDTGGFDPINKNDITIAHIQEQIQIALDSAQLILFVLDGKEDLNPYDLEISKFIRKRKKDVIGVVNKVESKKSQDNVYDFYRLGLETIIPVSAKHNIWIDDLKDEIINRIPEYYQEKDILQGIKAAIFGRPNVGKSTLVNNILGTNRMLVDSNPGTTTDSVDTHIQFEDKHYILIDTAGIRRKTKVSLRLEKYSIIEALKTINRCDIGILLIDAKEGVTEQDARIWGYIYERGKGLIIAVNKWDLIEKDMYTWKKYELEMKDKLKFFTFAPFISISALTGQRTKKIFKLLDEVSKETEKRIGTGPLNRFLKEVVSKHPPPRNGKRPTKFYYITQIGIKPPTFNIYCNSDDEIHFSYQRYLINQIHMSFGFMGTPLRINFKSKNYLK